MDTASVREARIGRIEAELGRLKAARPHLASRIDRAEHIIVTHLATANGIHRPIKARIAADGGRGYTVRSGSKLRRCYSVSGPDFRCDCPDSQKRNAACKHGIAAFVLGRAG